MDEREQRKKRPTGQRPTGNRPKRKPSVENRRPRAESTQSAVSKSKEKATKKDRNYHSTCIDTGIGCRRRIISLAEVWRIKRNC